MARFDGTTGKLVQNSSFVVNDSGEVTTGVWKGTEITVPYGGTGVSTLTGIVKGNGASAFSAATAGTDYLAPPSGTAILKANSGGALANATAGTDYLAPPSGTAILKANSGGALANAVAGTDYVTPTGSETLTNKTIAFGNNTLSDVASLSTTQTFTGAKTFRTTSGTRFEEASGQDAIIIDGRAGGTGSFAVTLTTATLSASRTLTLPEPGENVTLGYLNIPQVSQSAAYTLVATDAGKHILHPSADTTARTFTIPANSSVAYPVGTAITFVNQNGAGVVTIAITTDTMRLAGAGTTGSRTLAANGVATAIKLTSTEWIISGTGLT